MIVEPLDIYHACLKDLEALRRDADAAAREAGILADFLDRAHPDDEGRPQALADMAAATERRGAHAGRLAALIADLRSRIPGAVEFWADRHRAVCRLFLDGRPGPPDDVAVIRHVAAETLAAWERVARGEEAFVAVNDAWLRGYEKIFDLLDGRAS